MESGAAGKVIGEKKAKPRQWQRTAIGLVVAVIVVVAVIAIWKFYISPATQPEVISKEKITTPLSEKPSATMPPSTEVTAKEKVTPSPPEKPSRVATATPPVEKADPKKMAFALPNVPSIAVLPFVNMSGDSQQEFFSDGLTEDIITALSNHPKLFVVARNSTFTYKGKSVKVQHVAEDLGVRYVLEGSVQRSGDRVRITAQLIDALKGHHIWSERYDKEMRDIFVLQDKITLEVMSALDVKLSSGEGGQMYGKGTDNLEAYLKLLQARELAQQWNKESQIQARELAEEAIRLDPQYPAAYHWLAGITMMDVWLGISKSPKDSLMKAIELAQKATSLDDSLAGAHSLLGFLYVQVREHEKGIAAGERALERAPNSADAHSFLANMLNFSGRPEEAIAHNEKAFRLNPIAPPSFYYIHAAHTYRLTARYEDAVKMCKELLSRWPNNVPAHVQLVLGYTAWGHNEEARAVAQDLLRIDPKFSVQQFVNAMPYKDPALSAKTLELMRKAGLK